jgi:signal transduction histidine kinase/ActR/RegA family two-component response regulator
MTELLSKDHSILERPFMEFRPFGLDERGEKICDASGVIVCSNIEYLQDYLARTARPVVAEQAISRLCRMLNDRIPDLTYHVTPDSLANPWNSYSYEFICYLREFCERLSGDPDFHVNVGTHRKIPPLIQILGRPFTVQQLYKMWPYFGSKYVRGVLEFEVGRVTNRSAVLRMKFTDRAFAQFGPYRNRCVDVICLSCKSSIAGMQQQVHGMPAATVRDLACTAKGDPYCEWEFTWPPQARNSWPVAMWGIVTGGTLAYLHWRHPDLPTFETLGIAFLPATLLWWVVSTHMHRAAKPLQRLIRDQEQAVDAGHEELREAYLEQQSTAVTLRRKVSDLTMLHRAGLLFSSTFDREELLTNVLDTIVRELHYDRAMITQFDRTRQVSHDFRVRGMPQEVAEFLRTQEVAVTDPDSVEGRVLLRGEPVLTNDIHAILDRLHPFNQKLVSMAQVKSFISVPLKTHDEVIGTLSVDRTHDRALTQDDLDLLITLASQVAIALDNAQAYREIASLNAGLEARVRERTAELEAANARLKQLDRLKSQFLAHVSHELRTPLTSIVGFADNMIEGLVGSLNTKQEQYLARIKANGTRLARMITDLLDLSRVEAGKLVLSFDHVPLPALAGEVIEQLRPLATAKRLHLDLRSADSLLRVWADPDRLSQILTNLLDNAIKYTPEEGQVTVELSKPDQDMARIVVSDTGHGIPPEALPKLFDPFFRVQQQERSQTKGLGLGLAIVKDLVDLHGGTITVHSTVDQGTHFIVTLPMQRQGASPTTHPPAPCRRLLVVDDDRDICDLLRDRLESDGFQVFTATDGRAALRMLETTSIDGMLLDIALPDLDGFDVLRKVRATQPTLPVVMMTAVEALDRAMAAVEAGAQGYLLKPFDAGRLRQSVDRWFAQAPGGSTTIDPSAIR